MSRPKNHSLNRENENLQEISPDNRFVTRSALRGSLFAIVAMFITCAHWPALSARAVSFDDKDYLTQNRLVQNPSWASAWQFLTEIRSPSTVPGYYQPLNMISLM